MAGANPRISEDDTAIDRELAYYEKAYSSHIPELFAQPAVVRFREYLVSRILAATGAGRQSRVLSIGCGIGDTELLLARHVGHVTAIDLSPSAIERARRTASEKGVENVRFICGRWPITELSGGPFDIVVAVFFLHHLAPADLALFPAQAAARLGGGGTLYALDPSARRLSGFLGQILVPKLMKKYQTDDEHPLSAAATRLLFRRGGFEARTEWLDFISTPLAGLFPSWRTGYTFTRFLDDGLTRIPLVRSLSSNFELIARLP